MKYLFVFLSILAVWIAGLIVASLLGLTDERFQLYLIMVVFTFMLYLLGFLRQA